MKIKVKPAAGLKVRHPDTKRLLSDAGEYVDENNHYWARRLRDNDVEKVIDEPTTNKNNNNKETN